MKKLLWLCTFILSCSGQKALDILGTDYRGYIVVTTVATDPATGPGIMSLFKPNGELHSILHDYYNNGTDFPTGVAFQSPDKLIYTVNGSNRLEKLDLTTDVSTVLNTSGLPSFTLKNIARSTVDGSVYVVKSAASPAIDKFDSNTGVRSPFAAATVGACALATPYGIAFIPSTEQVAVISSAAAGRLSIYDKDGNCVSHFTTGAALSAGTPSGVAYHATTGKLIITQATSHAIYALNLDGTGATLIYQNSTFISTPRTITTDSNGYIYVSSSGTDTVEKLYWSGTGSATRATSVPLISTQVLSQNVTSILVLE